MDIFLSFLIVPGGTITVMSKTVASDLVNCQEIALGNVYFCAALKRINKICCKISIISLLNIIQCLLLAWQVSDNSVIGHIVQGGAI